jgi:hypothetical protein
MISSIRAASRLMLRAMDRTFLQHATRNLVVACGIIMTALRMNSVPAGDAAVLSSRRRVQRRSTQKI